ncbi:MAG TPA: MBL fold metallo-hydrolase [Thermoanaerobaculia bacterium]|jgi:glyoxylase-like metal-dependent hydrolase (beta-lactamase superfamily II)
MNHVVSRLFALTLAVSAFAAAGQPAPAAKAPAAAAPVVAQPFKDVGLWYGVFGGTLCSWLDAGDGVFLIDTGSSAADAKALRAEIAKTTKNKPVKWIAMTHLHTDSNEGLAAFFPTDATIFVNARATALLADFVGRQKGPAPNVIGVGDRLVLVAGKLRLEVGVPPANAHTGSDLYVFDAVTRTAFAGDLVTPERCPMLSDPDSDIKGWIVALDRLEALKPVGLVGSRGNPTATAAPEIGRTRHYLTALLQFLIEKKKQNAPEARVSGELAGERLGDYCPRDLSAINALSVYRRIGPDGSTVPGSALPPKTAPK